MPPLGLLIISYFLLVAFFADQSHKGIMNPLFAYYDIQIQFILNHKGIFIFTLLIIPVIIVIITRRHTPNFLKSYLHIIKKFLAISIAGSFFVFIFIFMIAIIELNILSVMTYLNPEILGIETNTETIIKKLKQQKELPIVISENGRKHQEIITAAINQSGKSNYYGSKVVPNIPTIFVIPSKKSATGITLIGNSLIVKDINSPDLQRISPIISNVLISKYFRGKTAKAYPSVSLMTKAEYLDYRKEDYAKKLVLFDEVINKIKDNIISLTNGISEKENTIDDNKEQITTDTTYKEKQFNKCWNTGYYKAGEFIRTNTKEHCQEEISSLEGSLSKMKQDTADLINSLEQDKKKLEQYQYYDKYYSSQKTLTQGESSYIAYEFGTFNPPDIIKIDISSDNNDKVVAYYLEVLVHEYLHYETYEESGKTLQSSFFTESLTEYFARQIIKDSMGVKTNLAYPANVKIIEQMAKRISESDFADVYFNHDQEGLVKLLNRAYGEDFYEKNIILLESLQYSGDTEQIVKLANEIMSELGGSPLDKNDVETTYEGFGEN